MDTNQQKSSKNILKLLQKSDSEIAIRRARFSKFYDYDNNKFFDFYLQNGAVLLGYQPKALSRILKNTVNRGFFHYAPSHFELNAKNALLKLFPHLKEAYIYFFSDKTQIYELIAKQNLKIEKNKDLISNPDNTIYDMDFYTLREKIDSRFSYYLLSPAIANSLPIWALVCKEALNIKESPLSPISFQTVSTSLSEYFKNTQEAYFKKLLNPYKEKIEYFEGGMFLIKEQTINEELSLKLRKKGIYITPFQKYFFLCRQSEEHQIDYLFKTLKKLND